MYKSFTAGTAKKADLLALEWQAKNKGARTVGYSLGKATSDYINSKRTVISQSTIRSYRTMQRRLDQNCKIMGKSIDMITRMDIQLLVNELASDHSPKTVRNYYGLLSAVFNSNGYTIPKCTLPQKVRPTYNIPDEDTIRTLFEGVKGTRWEVPILLAACGPMRRGEIVGARLDDLDGDVLHVHRCVVISPNGEVTKEYPKNFTSDRNILLPHDVAEKIRAQGYIYKGSLNNISKQFPKILDELGIERFRFHDLRHAFVSIAHAAGLPDAYIQQRGGWSTPYTMNAVYKHTLNADSIREQEAVNSVFTNLM